MIRKLLKTLLLTTFYVAITAGIVAATDVGPEVKKAEIYAQMGHTFSINALAFSPDGRTIISGSGDNALKLWDAASGRELRTFKGHGGIHCVAFSPDGLTIVSGNLNNTLQLWDVASGRELRTLKGHSQWVFAVAFAPDGHTIASGGNDNTIKLWDAANGRLLRTLKGHSQTVTALAFAPDGHTIVSGSVDHTIKFWNAASGRVLRTLKGHRDSVHSVAFSPDGNTIVSGSGDKTLKLWDISSGRELRTLTGHEGYVTSAAFSPDGRNIVSGSYDKTVKLWDIASGRELQTLTWHGGYIHAVAYSPDGRSVLSGCDDTTMMLWDAASGKKLRVFGGQNRAVNAVAVSTDGRYFASGNWGILNLWDASSGRQLRSMKERSFFRALAFSPDGRTIASDSYDNTVKLWDVASGTARTLKSHKYAIKAVAFSPDGRTIVSGSSDALKVWDFASGQEIHTIKAQDSESVATFSPDGRTIVSGSNDKTLQLWDGASGKRLRPLGDDSAHVRTVAFSPDGRAIVSGGINSTLKLWDIVSGRLLRSFQGHGMYVNAVAFSPDGRTIVSASEDKTIKLWDATNGRQLHTMSGHGGNITAVRFSPDGRNVISGSEDGTVRQWDVATGKFIAQSVSFNDGEGVTVTSEGYYTSSENGDKHLNVRVGNNVFGIDQYRESFYRPDVVKIAIAGGSLQEFRNIASIKQPPQVTVIDTPTNTGEREIRVKLRLTDMGGGIGDVRLYLNGSAVVLDNARGLKVVEKDDGNVVVRAYTIKLTNGSNRIRAIVFNADNTMQSTDALHDITAAFRTITKPTIYALVIGINDFKNPKLQLKYSVADAELFANTLSNSAAGLFEKVHIKKLTTKEATTSVNIKKELAALKNMNPDDLFVLYVASHGTVDDGEYFLITSNVGSTSTGRLKSDALTQTELKELVANIPTTKKVIILDTCNAGAMGSAMQVAMLTRGMSEDTAIKILSRAVGSTILSASTSTQEAIEGYKGHGLFTWVLTEGLNGKADKGKSGFIKTTDLADYVDTEVPALAEKAFKRAQYPTISISGQSFHIGTVRLK